jgi:hypothetical protein
MNFNRKLVKYRVKPEGTIIKTKTKKKKKPANENQAV